MVLRKPSLVWFVFIPVEIREHFRGILQNLIHQTTKLMVVSYLNQHNENKIFSTRPDFPQKQKHAKAWRSLFVIMFNLFW